MADWLTPAQRSKNMSSIRSRGNRSTEQGLIAILREGKVTGWRRNCPLHGKPDFAFPAKHVVVFVDGCFWHGCPRCYRMPGDNRPYWKAKLERNRRRDRVVSRTLRDGGWTVLRLWEHSLKRPASVLRRLRRLLDT